MPRSPLSVRLATLSAFGLLLVAGQASVANAQVTLGVMGDSLSDEYQYNGRAYAQNLVEQLATYDHVNLGASVSNLPPRYIGYNQNWALVGATSATVLSGGQASGLAAQIPNAGGYGIDYAALVIGANDFGPGNTPYDSIYNGTWTTAQIIPTSTPSSATSARRWPTFCPRASKRSWRPFPTTGSRRPCRRDFRIPASGSSWRTSSRRSTPTSRPWPRPIISWWPICQDSSALHSAPKGTFTPRSRSAMCPST